MDFLLKISTNVILVHTNVLKIPNASILLEATIALARLVSVLMEHFVKVCELLTFTRIADTIFLVA